MIQQHAFPVEPWTIRETDLDIERLPQTESIFALSNGHVGLRGNLDEGEPHGLPGTYLSGFWESRQLPYAEPGYGDPEQGQTVVNVTNGKIMRLLVGDSPFDLRYGILHHHERTLDMRAGVLRRSVEWTSPSHQTVKVSSTRLVSFAQRAIVAIEYVVEPVDGPARVVVQSELIANEEMPSLVDGDPRAGAGSSTRLNAVFQEGTKDRAVMVHETVGSGLRVAAGMRHDIDGPDQTSATIETYDDLARLVVACTLEPGQKLRIVKYVAYGWSRVRSTPALVDQASAALNGAISTGWDGLLEAQKQFLDDFWANADVELEGDPELEALLEVFCGRGEDHDPAMRIRDDNALLLELRESLPHGRGARAQAAGNIDLQ